jgi:translation initiation factor 1
MDDWKKKIGAATVYSTNPDFKFETEEDETETLPNNKQQLIVSIDKKQRKGKNCYIG